MSLPESATLYDISRTSLDTRPLVLTRRQYQNGPVVDQTGMVATLTFSNVDTGEEVSVLSSIAGGIATLDSSGQIIIDLGHADYVKLPVGPYAYRLDMTEAGENRPYMRGIWWVV